MVVVGDKVEVMSPSLDLPTRITLVMTERLALKLPQVLVLPVEVTGVSKYVGFESHDANALLAQLRESPCVTVQVKVTSSPGHAAVLPSCSTLDTNVTSTARN